MTQEESGFELEEEADEHFWDSEKSQKLVSLLEEEREEFDPVFVEGYLNREVSETPVGGAIRYRLGIVTTGRNIEVSGVAERGSELYRFLEDSYYDTGR